jgi:hypothetical protein
MSNEMDNFVLTEVVVERKKEGFDISGWFMDSLSLRGLSKGEPVAISFKKNEIASSLLSSQ